MFKVVHVTLLVLCLGFDTAAAQTKDMVGVVFARREVDLCAAAAGRLDGVLVELGERVACGTVVGRMADGILGQDLAQTNAILAARQAEAVGAAVRLNEARSRNERHLASPDSWSAGESAAVRAELELAKAELAGANAAVEREQAAVRRSEIVLAAAEIRAPFDGAVAQLYENEGTYVGAGAKILRLISDRELWIRFGVMERDVAGVEMGGVVEVSIEAFSGVYAGTIHHISPEIEVATGLIIVEADLLVPAALEGRILPGMRAGVRLAGSRR